MARDHFLINGQAKPGRCPICMMDDQGVFTEEAAEGAALSAVYHGLNPAEVEHTAEALDELITSITAALNAHVGAMITA